MKRHHLILVVILVVQIVLTAVVFWPRPVAEVSGPLFPGLEADDMVALTIADAEGNSILLRKVDGMWVLPQAGNYPAQADEIEALLEALVGLTTRRLVARSESSHRQLQVAQDHYERRIDLETEDRTEHTLYLGSSPSYGATHFRLEGQSETYLGSGLSAWETGATAVSWIDTAYVQIAQEELVRVTLENGNGVFAFVRDEAGEWVMEGLAAGETLAVTRVTAAIRQATALNMIEPLGQEELPEYGFSAPLAVVTMETANATSTLRVGAHDAEDDSYVVSFSGSPYFARVSALSVGSLVENARADFLEQ